MSNLERDIGSEDKKIVSLVDELKHDKLLVPTFQREFVWKPENILKLWDSIYRFYPIGSILYWETDSYLQTHRRLGGFVFPHDEDTVRTFKEWKYVLDGQQRATSLLVSMLGGKGRVEDNENFDYTLYFDATKGEFFFADQLEKRAQKTPREFLIRVRDVPEWKFTFYKDVSQVRGFNDTVEHNLQQLSRIFTDYKISVIRIKGVEVAEVCDIFERINQEGKKLDPVDIIVARTYRPPRNGDPGFYLRDYLDELNEKLRDAGTRFDDLEPLTIIQMFAMWLRKRETGARKSFGITPAALDNLRTEHFLQHWKEVERSILDTVKVLTDLRIVGSDLLPFAYLALPICSFLSENPDGNRSLIRQWFWRTAFGREEFRVSTDVYSYAEDFFRAAESGNIPTIEQLQISRRRLVESNYYYRNPLTRVVLAFLANQTPLDFSDSHAVVLDNVYLNLSQAPNLHHIYPRKFLEGYTLPDKCPIDSLMNMCFIRARTNIQIGDKNPLTYFAEFSEVQHFDRILESHLIPRHFLTLPDFKPEHYKEFLYARAEWFANRLKAELPDVDVRIVD